MADLFVKIDELADYAASFAKLAGDSESASKSLVQGFAAFDNAWGSDEDKLTGLAAHWQTIGTEIATRSRSRSA